MKEQSAGWKALAYKHDNNLYVFDEIMLTGGATTWDFAEEVVRRYGVF